MIKISPFSGMFPKISDKLLPTENATLAEQCDLESGSLRPARGLRQEVNLGSGLGSVFRTPEGDWMRWPVAGVNAVVSPINDDQYKRVYWTGDGVPKMASHAMAFGGSPAPAAFYPLGIPAPTSAPDATGSVLDCPEPEPMPDEPEPVVEDTEVTIKAINEGSTNSNWKLEMTIPPGNSVGLAIRFQTSEDFPGVVQMNKNGQVVARATIPKGIGLNSAAVGLTLGADFNEGGQLTVDISAGNSIKDYNSITGFVTYGKTYGT